MENAKKFFEEIAKTEEAKALFASVEPPATEEDRVAAYMDIAKKLHIELTAEDILAYFEADEKLDTNELDDEELKQLVGGGENAACKDTYQNEENCWWEDGCDKSYNDYKGYYCSVNNILTPKRENELKIKTKLKQQCGNNNLYQYERTKK